MGEYPGAQWAGVSPNKAPREGKVQLFIVHHWAGGYGGNREAAARAQRDVFMRPNARRVSPNFQVNADGSVFEIVPPDRYRAWTSGLIDHKAVTCETQNISGEPHWGVSAESHEAIARLVAWAAQRYGFPIQRGQVGKGNRIVKPGVIGHREAPTAATACPGPSMDLDAIVARARALAGSTPTAAPATAGPPKAEEEDDMYTDDDRAQAAEDRRKIDAIYARIPTIDQLNRRMVTEIDEVRKVKTLAGQARDAVREVLRRIKG